MKFGGIMEFIKVIIEKLKIKELFAIIFIAALIITFIPTYWANRIKIESLRDKYQTYITLCIIIIGAYYLFCVVGYVKDLLLGKIFNRKKTAIKYMKKTMSPDEMELIIEAFYDRNNNRFASTGKIDYSDGRKAPLEMKYIIYRASQIGYGYEFSYNLQPYALNFLNKNLKTGRIEISSNSFEFNLK